jgi:hypothetical protein
VSYDSNSNGAQGVFWFASPIENHKGADIVVIKDYVLGSFADDDLIISAVDSNGTIIPTSTVEINSNDSKWFNKTWSANNLKAYNVTGIDPSFALSSATTISQTGLSAVAVDFGEAMDIYGVKIVSEHPTSIYEVFAIPEVNIEGSCQHGEYLRGDIDKDCYVSFTDFAMLAKDWLKMN